MPQFATIQPEVTYTPGDGTPILIPEGRAEIVLSDDSAVLSWEDAPGIVGSAAMPRLQFDDYVTAGKIVWIKD